MARKSSLRAVGPGEKPAGRGQTVSDAAESGDRLSLLVALRARIAKSVQDPSTPARDLAALSRRLLEIAKDIEAIEAEARDDDIGAAAGTPDEEWASS
jgi:hypothetical protein